MGLNINDVNLAGRLTRDPELRHTPSGMALCELGLAVNRYRKAQDGSRQEEVAFIDVTVWSSRAENAAKYLRKGSAVYVSGFLKYDQWTTPEGQKRSKLTVTADDWQFVENKRQDGDSESNQGGGRPARHPEPSYGGPQESRGEFEEDIPF